MRSQCDLVIKMNIWIFVPLMAGESGGQKRLRELRNARNVNRFFVEIGTLATLSREQFIARRIVTNPRNHLLISFETHRYTEHGISVGEIRGAIERVDVPAEFAAGVAQPLFFAQNIVRRPDLTNALPDQRL